ncbi:grpE protein homolog 2, mitochondrial-like [Cynara cardunculus var. scolymus]|uniref:grpE protein homolog 2, mitochondrial-like n=1 Tax=Cynara cardunculus var. scolymus TaxID=59895 RepID=UPI000D625205|nr:grpE protein homolog 2, mitochondrial-like [Cynara cardunculus var. scolymus]
MRACALVSEIWRKKRLNLNSMRSMQISSVMRCYEDSRQLHSRYRFVRSPFKEVTSQVSELHNSLTGSSIYQCGFFSFASSQNNENEIVQPGNKTRTTVETNSAHGAGLPDNKVDSGASDISQSAKRRRRGTKRTKFSDSDSDSENDLSRDDLVKLLAKKEELLNKKNKEMEIMQEKGLRSFAEIDDVIARTKRAAENSKKFAIQSFAKSLLDVADNLGRASSVVKDKFTKIDTTEDPAGALPLLKTLLEGVEMTEKQLAEVFKKFGVERYDPVNEQFDPNRHNAVFQVPDPSKPPNTIAVVMKPGYTLHERIIRPAEVGVAVGFATDDKESD